MNETDETMETKETNETTLTQVPIKTLDDLKDELEPLDPDEAPRFKATQGALMDSDGNEKNSITGELISWNYLYILSPNVNESEARSYVRYTYDLENIVLDWDEPEKTVGAKEYIEHLKELGYDKAAKKTYIEVTLLDDESDQPLVLQLSPASVKKFKFWKTMTNKKIKSGKLTFDQATHVKAEPKKEKLGKFTFTSTVFSVYKD